MIVGKDVPLIEQILRVLTYFVRCSELAENTEVCPSLTADIDDTASLMSASDVATSVTCLAADVSLSSNCSTSTSVKSVSPVGAEKLQSVPGGDSSEFVLKPAPSGRDVGVHFENASQSLISGSASAGQNHLSAVASDCFMLSQRLVTTSSMTEPSVPPLTDSQLASEPHFFFRSDVKDTLPPLLGVTCADCSYIQSCKECRDNMPDFPESKNLSERNVDVIPLVPMCNLSDEPSDSGAHTPVRTDCEENLPSSDSPKLCQLSPMEANENVCVERVPHVGREQVEGPKPSLIHVPLEKPDVHLPYLCHSNTDLPVLAPEKHPPVKLSRIIQYEHSNSMFDEYYDSSSSYHVIDLVCSSNTGGKSNSNCQQDDTSTFDEIMNEPCPDVSHIDVSHLSSSSSSSDVTADPLLDSRMAPTFRQPLDDALPPSSGLRQMVPDPSTLPVKFGSIFDERHFASENNEQHLDDIPDGPSKQMISSAIKLMQDVCLDRTSQADVDDLADIPASDYFSQPGLGPSRGRQRHPSGQSNASARCWYDHLTSLS